MLRRLWRQKGILALAMILTLLLAPAAAAEETVPVRTTEERAPAPAPDPTDGRRPCFNLDLSTGTSMPFMTDPFGTPDPDWWVTAVPDSMAVPAPAVSVAPVPSWYTNPAANWVDARGTGYAKSPNGAYSGMDSAGQYTFATTFTLNGALYTNFVLHLNAYASDNAVQMVLDGNPVGPVAGFGPPNSTAVGGPLAIPVGPGTHTLEARVTNYSWWMGLLVNARVTADCKPDVYVEKHSRGDFVAGQPGTYVLMVGNNGPGNAAGPIYVTDTLPAGATLVSASGSGWTCTSAGSVVSCTHPGPLPAATSLPPIVIVITVPQGVDALENCASVDVKEDANWENNRSCVKDPVSQNVPGSICGVKFNDLNGNGTQDAGEPGLPNWTIEIRDAAGNVVATLTTGRDGTWCFKDLKPGPYTVSEVQKPNWVQTAPLSPGTYSVSLVSGQNVATLAFGNRAKADDDCCLTFRFPAGRADQFATTDGPEPASPSPGLMQRLAAFSLVGFDHPNLDKFFAHTFALPQGNCIEGARLTIRVRPISISTLNANDAMHLSFTGPTGSLVPGAPSWYAYFGTGNPGTALVPNVWSATNYPGGQIITLDLGALPGGGNLLPALHSLRFLDLTMQDDTSIDYAVLSVKFCECQPTKDDPVNLDPGAPEIKE